MVKTQVFGAIGGGRLNNSFENLFSLSLDKTKKIDEILRKENGISRCNLEWNRDLSGEEIESLNELESLLEGVELKEGVKDKWVWLGGKSHTYTVKKAYKVLMSSASIEANPKCEKAWHNSIPPKVSILVWRIFQDRISTKINLARRGVISQENTCFVGSFDEVESTTYFSSEFPAFAGIWSRICKWFCVTTVLHNDWASHFDQFTGLISSDRFYLHHIAVIWFAGIWSI